MFIDRDMIMSGKVGELLIKDDAKWRSQDVRDDSGIPKLLSIQVGLIASFENDWRSQNKQLKKSVRNGWIHIKVQDFLRDEQFSKSWEYLSAIFKNASN